ncbi:MAG TPA: hypothetical protein VMW04_00510 [Patescibacteria group bacterium]|nr:hypothetical protein [Patescibacteria group bacterium]
MKKEVVLAIAIGFGIGLIATFGVYNARKAIEEADQIQTPLASSEEDKANNSASGSQILSLASPLDQSIIKEGKTAINGTTSPSSWVIILTEKGEKMIQADKKGNFETEINLISGENEIEVQAINGLGEKASKTITVVYSTVEI